MSSPSAQTRHAHTLQRNELLQAAYRKRYVDLPRPRIYSRAYVLSQLAKEFYLSVATVERLVMPKAK